MQQLLIGVILVLGGATYYLHSQNQILQANNSALEGAVATGQDRARFTGIAFQCQLIDSIPSDEHDIFMHQVVTS